MTYMPRRASLDVIDLKGGARARGIQLGRQSRDRIHAFLCDGLARLDAFLGKDIALKDIEDKLHRFSVEIEKEAPALFEEIRGLSEGAGISLDEALLLQLRRELIGYNRTLTSGDCTTFARSGAAPVLGQTIDLAGDLDDCVTVLRVHYEETQDTSLILSFVGLLGYLGLNSRGLAVGLNLVLAGDWGTGLPPYLAIRHLIDTCASVDEAIETLSRLNIANSRSFMLCDTTSAAFVELANGSLAVHRGHELIHANHYLDPAFEPMDELNVFARNGSRRRLEACRAWLTSLGDDCTSEDYFRMFAEEPICVSDTGKRTVEKTVAAVVMDPLNLALHVRAGDPRAGGTRSFKMPFPN